MRKLQQLYKVKLFLIVGLLIALTACSGQKNHNSKEINTASIDVVQILSKLDKEIWSIFQDNKNNYWFGSNGKGIYFYDGEKLKLFTTKDGLVDNSIRGIQEDQYGNIFIQTPKGISRYNGETFTTLNLNTSSGNKWELKPNDLWFNANGNANDIYRYDGKDLFELQLPRKDLDKAFETKVQGLSFKDMNTSPYSVFGINKDKAGNLWIGTIVAGAFRYDGKEFLWFPEKELSTLPDGRVPGVRSMLEDKNGYFWLSNLKSKYKVIETDTIPFYKKLKGINPSEMPLIERLPYFNSGLVTKNGDLLMTTYGAGVWKYDGKTLTNFPVKIGKEDALIISIYEDNRGVFWLGTQNFGVMRFEE
jgi:ligand-binding sensor domain-containing protein